MLAIGISIAFEAYIYICKVKEIKEKKFNLYIYYLSINELMTRTT